MFKTSLKSKLMVAVMLIFGITAFMSCEKESAKEVINDTSKRDAINVGIVHNKSLSVVFSDLQELKKTKSSLSESDYINYTIQSSKDYLLENEGISIDEVNEVYDFIGINSLSNKSLKSSDNIIDINSLLNEVEDETYKSLLTRVIVLLENDLGSYSALDNELIKIEQDAVNTEYYEEIIAINSVARNSYLYWEENYDEWIALFSNGTKSVKVDDRFWDIMEADVQGAVGGAAAGASFLGVGALVGVLVGAPVSSGISGIFTAIRAAND